MDNNTNIYGVGLGIGLLTKGGMFTLNYANGSEWKEKIDPKTSKIHITFRSFF